MDNLGIVYALVAALSWGTYMVPFKISKSENLIQFQAVMALGILVSGIIISLLMGYSFKLNSYGLISGVMWAIANAVSLIAVLNLGMSRALPILSSCVIISSFLWGALVFNELSQGFGTGLLSVVLIILGVVLVTATERGEGQNVKKGLIAAILSGSIFGSQLAPLKIGNVASEDFFFSLTLGIFFSAVVIFLLCRAKFKKEALKMSFLSGVIWNIGNLGGVLAVSLIGLAKGIPMTQLSILVAVFWGLFYFKEVTEKRKIIQILIGAVILLLGVFILSNV